MYTQVGFSPTASFQVCSSLTDYITFVYDVVQFFGALDGHPRAAVSVEEAEIKVFDGFLVGVS